MLPKEIKKDLIRMKGLKVNPNVPDDLSIAITTFIQQEIIVGVYELDSMPAEYLNNLLHTFGKYPEYRGIMGDLLKILDQYEMVD